ncbi:DUF5680 domain-containing protein [Bifidobacterium avesanii]|uniref:DUF5680 domain-containing protein n=1 Tax=Bifidobacterium avesanii TaxID=1798157 RepID=A0A7K3TF54_9BIFI|nr:DUF5680 domain-containing protein [Bifidobacterium avesanii]KAB8295638.1 hypothetical protein DSM100685_0248 [Bifidobacterium avesanii]NEG77642.1 hypothetical protein [Bifidobacterium avesanii]
MIDDFPPDGLIPFLLAAKRATYGAEDAGAAAETVPAFDGSRQLEYREGPWLYRDVYFGSRRFAGQETVLFDGAPVWSMVYAGGMTDTGERPGKGFDDSRRVYAFLRRALRLCDASHPYRGPARHEADGLVYVNEQPDVPESNSFRGRERILTRDADGTGEQCLYALDYAGIRLAA